MITNILYVIISLEIGGTEKQLVELASRLDRAHFKPHVCCLDGGGPLVSQLEERDVRVTLLGFPPLKHSGKLQQLRVVTSQVIRLRRLIRRFQPDIVHAMLPLQCVIAGIASKLARTPTLITSRRGIGYCKEKHFFFRRLENVVNHWADAVVANSEAVRKDTVSRERIDERKLSVIYNGVRIAEREGKRSWHELTGKDISAPVVCLVANFFGYKGHRDFINAAAMIIKQVPDVSFILAGKGEGRIEIERLVKHLRIEGNVMFLGERADAVEIMGMADIVALSSHEEGFPNVILEAMAAGKPVVATDVGGVSEVVDDGVTGLLVTPRDPEKLACAIIRLLKDSGQAKVMGSRGREKVREKFSIREMVRAYESLYFRFCEGRLLNKNLR